VHASAIRSRLCQARRGGVHRDALEVGHRFPNADACAGQDGDLGGGRSRGMAPQRRKRTVGAPP
jgi:hypothetical protein